MCMKGPHRVIEVFPDGMAATRDLNGKEELSYVDSVPDVMVGDYVLVAYGCIIERLDLATAEQAIAAMMGIVSDERFKLVSGLGDDFYQPQGPIAAPAPTPLGQATLAFS